MTRKQPQPNVLFVDQTGQIGGAELMLLDLAACWRGRAGVVLFDNGPFREQLRGRGVPVDILAAGGAVKNMTKNSGLLKQVATIPAVIQQARKLARNSRGYDLLYANTQKAFVVSALAGQLARRPVVFHLHDILTAEHFSATNRRLVITLANRLAAGVVCNSQASRLAFSDAGGDVTKTSTVYNGLNPSLFKPPTPTKLQRLDEELGLGNAFTLGVFGRLTPWKGQAVLFDALEQLGDEALGPIRVLIVGEALFTAEDRAYAEMLKRRAALPSMKGRIVMAGFRSDIAALMHACDVVVHCSTQPEPFGRVVVEAMLCGKPVIASNAGGIPEIINDGRTGLLVKPSDPDGLADAIRQLRDQPAMAERLAQAGHEDASQRFTLEAMVRGVETQLAAIRPCDGEST